MGEERRKIGSYEIVRLLGKGGMSEVYEVENPRLGSRHALKLFTYEKDDPDGWDTAFSNMDFDDDFGEGKTKKSRDDAVVAAERKDRATLDAVRLLLDRASKRLHGLLDQ